MNATYQVLDITASGVHGVKKTEGRVSSKEFDEGVEAHRQMLLKVLDEVEEEGWPATMNPIDYIREKLNEEERATF